jgi:hypothetical protein
VWLGEGEKKGMKSTRNLCLHQRALTRFHKENVISQHQILIMVSPVLKWKGTTGMFRVLPPASPPFVITRFAFGGDLVSM